MLTLIACHCALRDFQCQISNVANAIVMFVCFTGIETKYIAKYTCTEAKNVTLSAKIATDLKEG